MRILQVFFSTVINVITFFSIIVSADVQFTYTPTYPDAAPEVGVVSNVGLSEHHIEELEACLNELVKRDG